MNFLSGILKRALPTNGLKTNEETLNIPTRMPISDSEALLLDR
jgi:hypothetical protein